MWNRFIIVMKGSANFGKTKPLLNSLRVIIVLTFVAAIAKVENHKERRTPPRRPLHKGVSLI